VETSISTHHDKAGGNPAFQITDLRRVAETTKILWEDCAMRAMQRLLLTAGSVLAFGLGALGAASADVVQEIVKRGELRVAVQTQGPPVSYVDTQGNRTGFAVELVTMMAEDMGVKLKLLDYDWKGLIPAVTSGKADFLAADMTPQAKRALVLIFTEPYMYSRNVIYAKKTKPFVSWKDACVEGVSVAVVQGSSNVGVLKAKCPLATIKEFAGGGPAVAQAVAADRADAGINDEASAKGYMIEYPEFKILEGAPDRGPLSFATRPEETHMVRWMDNYLMLIKADGRMDKLMDYWIFGTDWKTEKTPVPKG
jgi:polar amino acid transport system substrate-binding protein